MINREKIRKIGFDVDDTLATFNPVVIVKFKHYSGRNVNPEEFTSYSLEEVLRIDKYELDHFMNLLDRSIEFDQMEPLPGSREVVSMLASRYDLVAITARSATLEQITRRWLQRNFPDLLTNLHFAANSFFSNREVKTKTEIAKEVGVDLMIEDALHHADDLANVGIPTLLLKNYWNISDNEEEDENRGVYRVENWWDIGQMLL